jgi:hypothetical protein
MIKPYCFERQWITRKNKSYPLADPVLLDKLIHAFELGGSLVEEGIDFVFRGGTSLILLLETPERLSIDIDILTVEEKGKIENALNNMVDKKVFNEWQEDLREKKDLPKSHYKCYYTSSINPTVPQYVLLDVLFAVHPYPSIQGKIIKTPFFDTEKDIEVNLPTIEGITGDKLTAFAPHTIGIPFGTDKEMEINKQLFDIGKLFNVVGNISEIEKAFKATIEMENKLGGKSFTIEEVKRDLIETSLLISQIGLKNAVQNSETEEIMSGRKKLESHLLQRRYTIENLKINSAKCACLTSVLGKVANIISERDYNPGKIIEKPLSSKWEILKRLRTIVPEAYYYWQLTDKFDRESN